MTQPTSRRDPEAGGAWGILGGAFDPVHYGHLTLARDIRLAKNLDGVILIPSFRPPHRARPCVASFEERSEMLSLAVADDPSFVIDTIEKDIPKPGYTITVVRELKRRFPNAQFSFILGADNLTAFWNWREPMKILSEIHILAGARPGGMPESADRFPAGSIEYIPTSMLDVSSSGIRDQIKGGLGETELAKLMPQAVASYILARGLYQ
jgi:nicotinate-nucleotide adenylyltransferase